MIIAKAKEEPIVTNIERLKKFRLGNRKVEDKISGKIYIVKGTLTDKTRFFADSP